jgi:hypothetical protein
MQPSWSYPIPMAMHPTRNVFNALAEPPPRDRAEGNWGDSDEGAGTEPAVAERDEAHRAKTGK